MNRKKLIAYGIAFAIVMGSGMIQPSYNIFASTNTSLEQIGTHNNVETTADLAKLTREWKQFIKKHPNSSKEEQEKFLRNVY